MSLSSRLRRTGKKAFMACTFTAAQLVVADAWAASPSVEQALGLTPVQKDVEYAKPTADEVAKCKIEVEKTGARSGWVVFDAHGQVIRRFIDTNGDNTVDQWSYFDAGLEVYRDADTNANGKADQCRWLSTGGTRWGLDENEDGKVDVWKSISAEEVSAEAVAAMAARDPARFQRLLITTEELQSLGLGETQLKELGERVAAAPKRFTGLLSDTNVAAVATGSARWLNFSGTKPYLIPAGTSDSTKDILVYENIVAMFESGEAAESARPGQLQIGTMIKVGDVWRLIDMPELMKDDTTQLARGFFTDKARSVEPVGVEPTGGGEIPEKLVGIEKEISEATTAEQLATLKKKKADLIEGMLVGLFKPADREIWMRQLIDTLSEGAQTATYPEGLARLKGLEQKLTGGDAAFAPYARFSVITAEYMAAMNAPGASTVFNKIQAEWLESLKKFVKDFPASTEAADALSHLAIDAEFSGNEDEAKKLYTQIVTNYPKDLIVVQKASGALRRLESIGKPLALAGTTSDGKTFQLNMLQGKIVVVHFWSSEGTTTAGDVAQLKALQAKYPRELAIVGISLDSSPESLAAYLQQNRLPWITLFEKGGMESRHAVELGIFTVPTMIVVDAAGKVAVRNIDVTMLPNEIAGMVKK